MQITNLNMVYPTGQQVMNFPMTWVKPRPLSRIIRLVPPQGALSQIMIGPAGMYVGLLGGMTAELPALWFTDYVAGMWPFPQDITHAVAMQTAILFLEILSDAVSQGMESYNANFGTMHTEKKFGKGQSFAPRIDRYEGQVDKIILGYQNAYMSRTDFTVV